MTKRSILVHLVGLPPDENTLLSALSASRLLDASLEVLHVRPDTGVIAAGGAHLAGGVASPEVYESLEEEFTRRAEAAQAIYKKLAARQKEKSGQDGLEPVPMSYSEETGNVATIVSDNARFADLTVLIMPSVDVDARIVETAETVLFESGRPILFIPADLQTIAAENVVIGWDGSPHATRAGVDAIPFLLTAKNVAILTIASDADDHQNPDRFRNMLKRHGVSAALETIENADDDAGQVLLKVAESGMADLLVMGGYGKHPIREFIFGGATRTILNNAPIPILMSH